MSSTQIHTNPEATPPPRAADADDGQGPKIPASAVVIVAIVLTAVVVMTVAGVPAAGIGAAVVIAVEAVRRLYLAVRS